MHPAPFCDCLLGLDVAASLTLQGCDFVADGWILILADSVWASRGGRSIGSRLEARLNGIHKRMDAAYMDKLDGKIPEEFWERKMTDWRMEEQQVKMAIQGLRTPNAATGLSTPKGF